VELAEPKIRWYQNHRHNTGRMLVNRILTCRITAAFAGSADDVSSQPRDLGRRSSDQINTSRTGGRQTSGTPGAIQHRVEYASDSAIESLGLGHMETLKLSGEALLFFPISSVFSRQAGVDSGRG
jgi:hypothetical protein